MICLGFGTLRKTAAMGPDGAAAILRDNAFEASWITMSGASSDSRSGRFASVSERAFRGWRDRLRITWPQVRATGVSGSRRAARRGSRGSSA